MMQLQRKNTHHKPWTHKCPRVSVKLSTCMRTLAGKNHNKRHSATKTCVRPLATEKQITSVSAPTAKRAEKLRKRVNKILRFANAKHHEVSEKVNKTISGRNQNQTKTKKHSAKFTKVTQTQKRPKQMSNITQVRREHTPKEHYNTQGHTRYITQVNTLKTLSSKLVPNTKLRTKNPSDHLKNIGHRLNPGDSRGDNYGEHFTKIKVKTKNEPHYQKEFKTEEITLPGPIKRKMNEESYIRPPTILPDQILEPQEDRVQVKEPNVSEADMEEFDRRMECPYACAMCKESFTSPQKLEVHVSNHRRSTPKLQGSLRAQPESSFIPQETEGELVKNTPILEPQTQEATHELATGGGAEEELNLDPELLLEDTQIQEATHELATGTGTREELDSESELLLEDTQIIPETPDQDTTRGCGPGGGLRRR